MEIKDKLNLDQNRSLVDASKYRSMIGALIYLTSSRPDIVHATCLYARYQETINIGLWYTKDSGFELTGFSDADYVGCKDTFKSTSGGAQFLGVKLVSWSSKKQDCTVLSTAEAEYVSLFTCCAQVLWMRTQLTDYGYHFNKILIYCDSKSAIAISCNPVQHLRTKHIVVRYHFIKEHVEKGTIELYFVKTDYQLADLFTKALQVDRFNYLVRYLGMRSFSPMELERLEKSYQNQRDLPRNTPLDRVEVLVPSLSKILSFYFCVYGDEMISCNKDKKGAENLVVDHLSRLENPDLGAFTEEEIVDEFLDEHLMILKTELNDDEPWYADYVNYIVGNIVPLNWTPEKSRRFFSQVKNYFWDEPYTFKLCPDNVMRRCVAGNEILEILAHCHSGPTGGHHSASITGRKVYES
ncbi:hypothetical protein Tco_1291852, partial [Tanacetum coccineum]